MRENKLGKVFKIIFIIAIFVLIGFTNGNSRKLTLVESFASRIISLPQKGYIYLKKWMNKDAGFFEEVSILKDENRNLKEENTELKSKLMNYEVILSQNVILKEHANLSSSYPNYKVVVADIIREAVSNWEEIYVINRGSNDGVMPGMAVVAEDGLVGYIVSVDATTSKIVSIIDPRKYSKCEGYENARFVSLQGKFFA